MLFIIIRILLQLVFATSGSSKAMANHSCGSSISVINTSCGSRITTVNTSCSNSITTVKISCGSSITIGTTSCGSSIAAANLDETNFKFTQDIVRRNESDRTFKAEVLALNLEVAADMVDQAARHRAIVECTWEDFPLSKSMWEHIIRLQAAVFRYRAGIENLEVAQHV